ncbi:MAG: cache domain-containing protein [Candidatus Methanomethylophilaceae archaeon]|nr:cache domain-containing protein [Candidatus Methanomethylophilaceae archaeon]
MNASLMSFVSVCVLGLLLMAAGCTQNEPGIPASTPQSPDAPQQGNYTSNETLVAFVESAVAYAHANGKEKALAEFSDPNGTFVQGELYIYAYDFNNTTLAHPFDPEKIGVNRADELDAFGNPYTRQFIDAAKRGSGFVRFYYINPAHNRTVESKLGYVMKVDEDWWLGSGVYTGRAPTPVHTTATIIPATSPAPGPRP